MTELQIKHIERFVATHTIEWQDLVGIGRTVREYAKEYADQDDLYERTCADLGIGPAWVTPESLIESFGDQAYHKAMRMFVEMISFTPDDFENINVLRDACYELMQRGYHKKPQNCRYPRLSASALDNRT